MKKPTLLLCAVTLLCNLSLLKVSATEYTNQEVVSNLQHNALKSDLAYKIAESLTVEVGPRLAGSHENALAVDWAEAKLKSLGFDKVYREPVTVPVWQRGEASAAVIAPYPQKLIITALGGSVATPTQGLQATVIRFNDLQSLIAAEPSLVAGKIVFIDQKTERHKNGSGYGKSVGGRANGAVEAARKGAVAVLIRSIGTDHDRMAHTGLMHYQDGVPKIPAAALTNPDATQLDAMLTRGHEVTLALKMTPKDLGTTTTYNVIGEVTGSSKPKEIVLLGAHLDSWDEGTGAIDDAAGVAIVTAAAKLIGDQPKRPARTVRVVLFAAEEIGLIGGKAYAAQHQAEMNDHYIAAESDFGAGRIYRADVKVNSAALSAVQQQLSVLAAQGVTNGDNQARGGSEVSLLPAYGVPVASLRQDGEDYFDYHHTPNDTLDKIEPAALAQNVAVYASFAYQMAQSILPLRPLTSGSK
ncbi:M20/M25/M40 family metallo-hydrolase [Shewanella yunxiaonensis]|uniref:Carboxypeptidase Q n=1 Tax=Shewanella yunxiaonensis TaxID=2829809 RepID=A0ABX7YVI6_9GAMM|nr:MULTISPECIES: M20/M25/M40 family metallo-hydrolase [Shewanella]MDF0532896.1 M20/M25/M40 family metallo-hydrolase [Shewanella sp. A32]QUN06778.1 M20/M25/M40 family metallo-hydrolase [Shewanella yunxiaonensis]